MCLSAAMLKQVSNLKIVHTSITRSSHGKGWVCKAETQDLGDFNRVPAKHKTRGVFYFPPAEVDPSKASEYVDI